MIDDPVTPDCHECRLGLPVAGVNGADGVRVPRNVTDDSRRWLSIDWWDDYRQDTETFIDMYGDTPDW